MKTRGLVAVWLLWRAARLRRRVSHWLAKERHALAMSELWVKREQIFSLKALQALRQAEALEKRARMGGEDERG